MSAAARPGRVVHSTIPRLPSPVVSLHARSLPLRLLLSLLLLLLPLSLPPPALALLSNPLARDPPAVQLDLLHHFFLTRPRFQTFGRHLNETGVWAQIVNGVSKGGKFTLFAPLDYAWAAYPDVIGLRCQPTLRDLVTLHVSPERFWDAGIRDMRYATQIPTLSPARLSKLNKKQTRGVMSKIGIRTPKGAFLGTSLICNPDVFVSQNIIVHGLLYVIPYPYKPPCPPSGKTSL